MEDIIKAIREHYLEYSVEDVAAALFVSELWLPNLASYARHQLYVAIFLSQNLEEFNVENKIKSYADFKEFLKKLYSLSPEMHMLEDYIPSFDWGNVKFYLNGKAYPFFYGGVGNMFDLLKCFEMIFLPFDEEYKEFSGRSPKDEIEKSLLLQEDIVRSIEAQPPKPKLDKVLPGELQIPSKPFWGQANKYYRNVKPEQILGQDLTENLSTEFGQLDQDKLTPENFGDEIVSGKLIRHYFVKYQDKYLPVAPRQYAILMTDLWGEIYERYKEKINKEDYQRNIALEVSAFLRDRFNEKVLFPFVSAIKEGPKPHELVFSAAILNGDRLILVYNLPPFHKTSEAEKELKQIKPLLIEAEELLRKQPVQMGWLLKNGVVRFEAESNGKELKPEIFTILPQTSSEPQPFRWDKDIPGRVLFLDQFLTIMDEVESEKELSDFLVYLDEYKRKVTIPLISIVDIFASYRDASGVLIEGAREPDMIALDPNWGANWRYNSLAEFWGLFPEIDLHRDPQTWTVSKETETRIRLSEKADKKQCIILFKVGSSQGWTTSPFIFQKYETAVIANLLMECLEDYFARHKFLSRHQFFEVFDQFQVNFFPDIFLEQDRFEHLRHLGLNDELWKLDSGYPAPRVPGIRAVFDHDKVADAFEKANTNDLEIDLITSVIEEVNRLHPDSALPEIIEELNQLRGGKPRFKIFKETKPVSFPDRVRVVKPELTDHKMARKKMAQIALKLGLKPGSYTRQRAKSKLEKLRNALVKEVNSEVTEYDFKGALPQLLGEVDALTSEAHYGQRALKNSLTHEVDFVREKDYAERNTEYIGEHRNYRYLIEKFVQLRPSGTKQLDDKNLKSLLASVDKILEIYSASDAIHYEIYPLNVKVTRDFVVQIRYKQDIEKDQSDFAEEDAKITLGTLGNQNDRLDSPDPIEDYLEGLDTKFREDFGFSLQSMVNVLQTLSSWASYAEVPEATHYAADIDTIKKISKKVIMAEISDEEIEKIVNFLVLDTDKVLTIKGQSKPASDLPVWEHIKRLHRYTIRPIIKIDSKFYWGPFSTYKSAGIWTNTISDGRLPADLAGVNTKKFLEKENAKTEKALEVKAKEITKRHTSYAERVNYTRGTHPQEIGEYDVLAYIEDKNILLNIECKDIVPAYSLKDAKRLKETIFKPEEGRHQGNIIKVENRETYLRDNIDKFRKVLGWPIKENPKVVSLYVTRRYYWWTKYPPRKTDVIFLRLDLLDDYLKNL